MFPRDARTERGNRGKLTIPVPDRDRSINESPSPVLKSMNTSPDLARHSFDLSAYRVPKGEMLRLPC